MPLESLEPSVGVEIGSIARNTDFCVTGGTISEGRYRIKTLAIHWDDQSQTKAN